MTLEPDANDEPHLFISLTIAANSLIRILWMAVCC